MSLAGLCVFCRWYTSPWGQSESAQTTSQVSMAMCLRDDWALKLSEGNWNRFVQNGGNGGPGYPAFPVPDGFLTRRTDWLLPSLPWDTLEHAGTWPNETPVSHLCSSVWEWNSLARPDASLRPAVGCYKCMHAGQAFGMSTESDREQMALLASRHSGNILLSVCTSQLWWRCSGRVSGDLCGG